MYRRILAHLAIIWGLVAGLLLPQGIGRSGAEAAPQAGFALAWGDNTVGQLGDGLPKFRTLPSPVVGVDGNLSLMPVAFSAGFRHNLALLGDGRVLAWGEAGFGLTGRGPIGLPTVVTAGPEGQPLRGIASVVAGADLSLALDGDGIVYAWGANPSSLGEGRSLEDSAIPLPVRGLDDAMALAAGTHSLALRRDGTVWSWGANYRGQLGDGSIGAARPAPAPVAGLTNIQAIVAGGEHSLALRRDGTVWAWGRNEEGQLGDGTRTAHLTPILVAGLTGVVAVAAGERHSMALLADGTLRAWGNNDNGQVGNGSDERLRLVPSAVVGLGEVAAITAGTHHSLAVRRDGSVWAWGSNFLGQLGDGTTVDRRTPIPVRQLGAVALLSAGGEHNLALLADGSLQAWGDNHSGELGQGLRWRSAIPNLVVGAGGSGTLDGTLAVHAGTDASLALRRDGSVWGWGVLPWGAMGNGSERDQPIPQPITMLKDVATLSTGYSHHLVLLTDGTVLAWGENTYGQLGDGTRMSRRTPVAVAGLRDVVAVAAGVHCSFALLRDGTVRAWGMNSDGRLGLGGKTRDQLLPVAVPDLQGVAALAIGRVIHLALLADGTVFDWGLQSVVRPDGVGISEVNPTPTLVPGLRGVTAIAAGFHHRLALLADGTVWGWGGNSFGQVNDGPAIYIRVPERVHDLSGVTAITVGDTHSLALLSDGTLRAWGDNVYGQLGDGTRTQRRTPVPVVNPDGGGVLQHVIAVNTRVYHTLAIVAVAPSAPPAAPAPSLPGLPNTGAGSSEEGRLVARSVSVLLVIALGLVLLIVGGQYCHQRRTATKVKERL